MKKFSFLLLGVFLLGTITFALAEDKDANALTGSLAGMPNTVDAVLIATPEVATGTTAEVATGTTAEATTGTTTEVETGTVAEVTTGDTTANEICTNNSGVFTSYEDWPEKICVFDDDTFCFIESLESGECKKGGLPLATTGTVAETTTGTTAEATTGDTAELAETTDAAKSKYSEEQVAAYEWALENGITTINDIEKARLSDGLTRAELAKMMSQYLTKVLGKTPTTGEKVNYADVNSSLGDLADFIEIAYSYKIMGINADGTPLKNFNPRGKVTRAEYATVFSRVLFGDKYNKSEGNYYEYHIKALKEAGILTNDTPSIQEVRGWVMLMMYRSTNVKIETPAEESTGTVIGMANPASVYCEEQGGTLTIVEDKEGNQSGICKLADGTEVEEWEYYRANHKDEAEATSGDVAPLYTEEELKAAEAVINNYFEKEMTIKIENVKISYLGDEKAISELSYCKEFEDNAEITIDECVVFESEFFIPEQDVVMAGAFEPNTTITGYQWYLGRTKGGEWKILTMGY